MGAADIPESGPGRRPGLSRKKVEQIIQMRRDEKTLMQIAIKLNKDTPMPGG